MKNWKVGALANYSLSRNLLKGRSVFVGNHSQLVGDFKRSPIVSDRGSASQWPGLYFFDRSLPFPPNDARSATATRWIVTCESF
jgi:hypothetical protein